MHSEKGWRWDAPTAASTLTARQSDDREAERRGSVATVEESAVHDFAVEAAAADDVESVRRALTAAARWAAGEEFVSLVLCDDGAATGPATEGATVAIRVGETGTVWGRLVLRREGTDPHSAARSAIARRRLETLATLAAFAMERLRAVGAATMVAEESSDGPWESSVQDATLLSAVLPFSMSQARRHEEPLSILCMEIDRLRGVRELLGMNEANRVVERVGARIAGLLRSSDLVGRLDDDRLLAILPRAELHDAARVAEKLCQAISGDEHLLGIPLAVSLSVGAASSPADSTTLGGVLDAADSALAEARRLGPGRVATAPRVRGGRDWGVSLTC